MLSHFKGAVQSHSDSVQNIEECNIRTRVRYKEQRLQDSVAKSTLIVKADEAERV